MPVPSLLARLREPSTWASIAALAGTAASLAAGTPGGGTASDIATGTAAIARQAEHAAATGAPLWLILITLVSGGLGVYLRERGGQPPGGGTPPAA